MPLAAKGLNHNDIHYIFSDESSFIITFFCVMSSSNLHSRVAIARSVTTGDNKHGVVCTNLGSPIYPMLQVIAKGIHIQPMGFINLCYVERKPFASEIFSAGDWCEKAWNTWLDELAAVK